MPNWVMNRVVVFGDKDELKRFKEKARKETEDGPAMPFSFDALVPMPREMKVEESGSTGAETDLLVYLSDFYELEYEDFKDELESLLLADTPDFFDAIYTDDSLKEDYETSRKQYFETMAEKEAEYAVRYGNGKKKAANILKYGSSDWYTWHNRNWGTKWDACNGEMNMDRDDLLCYSFLTAWDAPLPVIAKAAEDYPDLMLCIAVADEDIGNNLGFIEVRGDRAQFMDMRKLTPEECERYARCVWDGTLPDEKLAKKLIRGAIFVQGVLACPDMID